MLSVNCDGSCGCQFQLTRFRVEKFIKPILSFKMKPLYDRLPPNIPEPTWSWKKKKHLLRFEVLRIPRNVAFELRRAMCNTMLWK